MVVLLSGLGAFGVWAATGSWWALCLLAVGAAVDGGAMLASVPHLRAGRRRPLVPIWAWAHAVGLAIAAAGLAAWALA